MNVIDDAPQPIAWLDDERLVSPLEKVSALLPEPIKPCRKRALKPVHAFNQSRLRSLKSKPEGVRASVFEFLVFRI